MNAVIRKPRKESLDTKNGASDMKSEEMIDMRGVKSEGKSRRVGVKIKGNIGTNDVKRTEEMIDLRGVKSGGKSRRIGVKSEGKIEMTDAMSAEKIGLTKNIVTAVATMTNQHVIAIKKPTGVLINRFLVWCVERFDLMLTA